MYHFCTLTTFSYIARVLVQYESLQKQVKAPFTYWVLCIDKESRDFFRDNSLGNIRQLYWEDIATAQYVRQWHKHRKNDFRNFCFLSKPYLLNYLLTQEKLEALLYIDSDLIAMSNPTELFTKYFPRYAACLTPHYYSNNARWLKSVSGAINAGFIGVTSKGSSFIKWWLKKCMKKCQWNAVAKPHEGGAADQGYLENVPQKFSNIKLLGREFNTALWNVGDDSQTISNKNKRLFVNQKEMVFFHFCGLRLDNWKIFTYPRDYGEAKEKTKAIYDRFKKYQTRVYNTWGKAYQFEDTIYDQLDHKAFIAYLFSVPEQLAAITQRTALSSEGKIHLYYNYASFLVTQKKYREAKHIFTVLSQTNAIISYGIKAGCFYYLGVLSHREKKTKKARDCFTACLTYNPQHGRAREYVVKIDSV